MRTAYSSRFQKAGNSFVIPLPHDVHTAMSLSPGDLVVMRVVGKLLVARRLDPKQVIDLDTIPADALPSAVIG